MRLHRFYTLALVSCLFSMYSQAQDTTQPFIKVYGEVTKPLKLYKDDLDKMKRITVMLQDRTGAPHSYAGVPVQALMEMAGVTTGKNLRGENLSKYLMVKSGDNYQVLFSLAELDSGFTDRVVILADEFEGKPIPDGKGPFRLVVPGEKKPARSSMQVIEFVVRFAKE